MSTLTGNLWPSGRGGCQSPRRTMKKDNLPEIPAALASVKRLSSEDWQIKSVSIFEETDLISNRAHQFVAGVVTGINLEAELVPWTEKARNEISSLIGQCFFVCDNLFQIRHWEYGFDPCECTSLLIKCRCIWSKPKAEPSDATSAQVLAPEEFR